MLLQRYTLLKEDTREDFNLSPETEFGENGWTSRQDKNPKHKVKITHKDPAFLCLSLILFNIYGRFGNHESMRGTLITLGN